MAIGAHNVELWRTALERLIDFRDRGNEDRFHDLSFEAVQRDPIGRGRAGSTPSSATSSPTTRDERMQDWWSESSKDRSGPAQLRARGLRPRSGRDPPSSSRSTTTDSTSPSEDCETDMSTIFVTGGTGLTGANVCEQLIERGDDVRALVRNPDEAAALARHRRRAGPGRHRRRRRRAARPPRAARRRSTAPRCSAGPARTWPTSRPSTWWAPPTCSTPAAPWACGGWSRSAPARSST